MRLEIFGWNAGFPFGATERAVIKAGLVLITGELAIFAERDDVEPVAISVEMIFGEVFVPFDAIFRAKFFGLGPGFGFDANEFDVASVGVFLDKIVAEFVKKL